MVHRDIKPSNILVSLDGKQVKLVDLGLARLQEPIQEGANRVTQEGLVIGTPDFLAPEQARNPAGVDIRADIYALGATLFYILTAKVPYEGANATEKLLKHCTDPPPSLMRFRPDAHPHLDGSFSGAWRSARKTVRKLRCNWRRRCSHSGLPPPGGTGRSCRAPGADAGTAAASRSRSTPILPTIPIRAARFLQLRLSNRMTPRSDSTPGPGRLPHTGLSFLRLASLLLAGSSELCSIFAPFGQVPLPPVESFTNSVDLKMVRIDGGTFKMGSPAGEPGRLNRCRGNRTTNRPNIR